MPSGWTAPHFALSGDDIAVASVTRGWTFGKIARLVTVEPIGRALWLEAKQARGIAAEDCGLDGSVSSAEWDKVMRSAERRVGKEWVSRCKSGGSPDDKKK